MFYKVKDVKPMSDYKLLVLFENEEYKLYNVVPLFDKWEAFKTLSDVNGLFKQVKVDVGGYGVSWNDDIDLSCNELWYNGISISDEEADDVFCLQLFEDYENDTDQKKDKEYTLEKCKKSGEWFDVQNQNQEESQEIY